MRIHHLTFMALVVLGLTAFAAPTPEWVQRSNENSTLLLEVMAKYAPEMASSIGVESHDKDVTSLPLDLNARSIADLQAALQKLDAKLATEKEPSVLQDLQILTNAARLRIEGTHLGEKYNVPYFDIPLTEFQGRSEERRVGKECKT